MRMSQAAVAAAQPVAVRVRWPDAGRLIPAGRSVAFGFALVALAAAAYAGARTTSVFAIERIEIEGLPSADAASARAALLPLQGRSLVSLRRTDLDRRLAGVPGLLAFEYDRAFPHTLVVRARPEVPVAVLRRGAESWLVSRRGRVLRLVPRGALSALPRIWVSRRASVSAGTTLPEDAGGTAARALALLAEVAPPARARTVRTNDELTYVLRSGVELRLGSFEGAELKLAIAAEILPLLDEFADYLDVTVASRPVSGPTLNPKIEVHG